MWELMSSYLGSDVKSIQRQIANHVEYTLARTRFNFDNFGAYQAAAYAVRDRLLESWNDTQQFHEANDAKRVFYFSLEFLMGRTFQNALVNSDLEGPFKQALMEMGYDLEELYEQECDAALGNGGLGRLAACFIDSLATLEIPAWGYGIRYDYGIFKQQIVDGYQVEIPDYWLNEGNPWEVERRDITYHIRFYGTSNKYQDGNTERSNWEGCQKVVAMAYDTPIPGFNTYNTNNLRLWSAKPRNTFDFNKFNSSDYHGAIKERQEAEYITSVLYPNDETDAGKELRLKQQYFFCSASIYDIIRTYKSKHNDNFAQFAAKNKIQLNDTHPAIATVELLRILIDEEKMSFEQAWNVVYNTFSYTNHTVLPEALEKWSTHLIGRLLPRHLELIYLINHIYLQKLRQMYPGDDKKVQRMSLVEEGYPQKIRMAYLSIVCSHTVNGVAALHSDLLKQTIFSEFDQLYPGKIQNKTNGVTPRRWIHCCNQKLSDLISDTLGGIDEWITSLDNLKQLMPYATDKGFMKAFMDIKRENKIKLKNWVKERTGIDIPVDSMYDIQVKRIHEYKRQMMNILYVIHRYLSILDTPQHERRNKFVPRVVMIGGKAAPGYANAKAIIKLINAVSAKVNNDSTVGDLLKVVFLPNYNVSSAQIIIPAAELSQHISTAGTEASGTSNMKFVMNGGLIIGTMDGANVEIAQEIGENNMFIFGERVEGVNKIRKELWEGKRGYVGGRLKRVFDTIRSGFFGDTHIVHGIIDSLENGGDHYITCFDFYSYIDAQNVVDQTYRDYNKWTTMAITGIAKSGFFSSDRTIAQYCSEIWDIQPVPVPHPSTNPNQRTRSFANLAEFK